MSPQRIQLKRSKGWRKPEGAVVVSRPSRWGNPYTIQRIQSGPHRWWAVVDPLDREVDWFEDMAEARRVAALMYEPPVDVRLLPTLLRGKDLACWCPLDQPCHADVLLELANPAAS